MAAAGDWRDDCVKPAKDTRVQTEVKYSIIFIIAPIGNCSKYMIGRDSN